MKKKTKLALAVTVWVLIGAILTAIIGTKALMDRFVCFPKNSAIDFIRHKNLRILITAPDEYLGERQTCLRMVYSLGKMGYCPVFINNNKITSILTKIMHIDMSINLYENTKLSLSKDSFNYLIYHHNLENKPRKKYDSARDYDGILSVAPIEKTREVCSHSNIIPFYLSAFGAEFYESPKTQVFFGGIPWDKYRTDQIKDLYKKLDATGYFYMYGPQRWRELKLKSYKGFIPSGADTVLKTMQKHGITLVLHSEEHFNGNVPTSRIFEAAAASCVIISDRLPFIVENFGDSVLYIDRDISPEEMFKQVDTHVKWIQSHQKEATELARRSHRIFMDKFTLEHLLQNVIDNYKEHAKEKK